MLALLLAAATPMTAVEAERAFAAEARTAGQWTAFRRWSTPEAVMFFPQPARAHEKLRDAKDPATALLWSPTASFVSCDGTTAVNTGEWHAADGSAGFFSTVWARQPDGGWKWIVDGGDTLATPRAPVAEPKVERAACGKPAAPAAPAAAPGVTAARGHSPDHTLLWRYEVAADGTRLFEASLYDGAGYRPVISDRIAAPPPPAPAKPAPAKPAPAQSAPAQSAPAQSAPAKP